MFADIGKNDSRNCSFAPDGSGQLSRPVPVWIELPSEPDPSLRPGQHPSPRTDHSSSDRDVKEAQQHAGHLLFCSVI